MNKTISLAAIGMVAVVMGMSVLAPAMAIKPVDVLVCHFDIDNDVSLITVNANGVKAHVGFNSHLAHTNHDGTDFEVTGVEPFRDVDCPVHPEHV